MIQKVQILLHGVAKGWLLGRVGHLLHLRLLVALCLQRVEVTCLLEGETVGAKVNSSCSASCHDIVYDGTHKLAAQIIDVLFLRRILELIVSVLLCLAVCA